MANKIEERLRKEAHDATDWNGDTMKIWDDIRHKVETLKGSDLPRLMFEGVMEGLAELMVEAADEINRYACQVEDLEAECDRLAAQHRAAIEHRPWWWRLIGLDHMRRT